MERKNKGGRPRASRVQKKSRAVTVRYSALQYDIVRHRARTEGFRTLTEYVREASVNAEVVQNFIQEHNAVFRDLSGLCNNLNQLTRLAHAQGLQSTEGALSDLSMLAADLAIGLIASGQEKKSEEQDLTPNKKRGPRL